MTDTILNEVAQNLDSVKSNLPPFRQEFADDLIAQQLNGKKPLSEKQAFWLNKLFEMATEPKPEPKKVVIGSVAGIIALFQTAGSKLKYPAIVIDVSDVTIRMYRAGAQAKEPGSVTVTRRNEYGEYEWIGRVSLDGNWTPGRKAEEVPMIEDFLTQFAADPAGIAAAFGKKTGRCCFCNSALTDERSLHVGYGPTCASHYELPYPKKSELN
jgi:hypothetical protein